MSITPQGVSIIKLPSSLRCTAKVSYLCNNNLEHFRSVKINLR